MSFTTLVIGLFADDSMDYTVYGILQARILEWVAFSFSRGSPQPGDQIHIAGRFFTSWTTGEVQEHWSGPIIFQQIFPTTQLYFHT